MMNVPDWNRQHTLMLVIMGILAVGVYVFGHMYFVSPVAENAAVQQEVLVEKPTGVPPLPPDVTPEDLAKAEKAIPVGGTPADALTIIEQIGKDTGVSIASVTSDTEPAQGEPRRPRQSAPLPQNVTEVPHTIKFTADTLQNANAFLDGLNNSERYFRTDRMMLSQNDGVSVDLSVTAFIRE